MSLHFLSEMTIVDGIALLVIAGILVTLYFLTEKNDN